MKKANRNMLGSAFSFSCDAYITDFCIFWVPDILVILSSYHQVLGKIFDSGVIRLSEKLVKEPKEALTLNPYQYINAPICP